jgi:flavin-binding protein dodecin
MSDHIFKKVEITGTSQNSMEEGVNNALQRAGQSLRNLRWLEHWLLRRKIASGALVSVFHPEAGASLRTSNVAQLLWRAAKRAGMEFLCRSGMAKRLPPQGWFASPAGLLLDQYPHAGHRPQLRLKE